MCDGFIQRFIDPQRSVPGFMTVIGFEILLYSKLQDIFELKHREVYQDMTQPINHYYIASSHNTYLVHDQLIGESSVEGYINALKKGARCVEIDIWDGADNAPVVYHGHTLTSRILLSDVLDVIRDYAFVASAYPLVLSLEIHCSLPQQIVIAQLMKTKLGDFLYNKKIETTEDLPSPDQLQKLIFLKAKKLKEDSDECESGEEFEEEENSVTEMNGTVTNDEKDTPVKNNSHMHRQTSQTKKTPMKVAQELSDLVNFFQAKSFKSFEDCKNWNPCEMYSLSESKAENLSTTSYSQFIESTSRRICRIYPRGTRTDSSNYSPIPFWNVGCQMVALNYQTAGIPMMINDALFSENGNCGYVLKPAFLRNINAQLKEKKMILKLKIISGQRIPKPGLASEGEVVDPYVVIRVDGHPKDEQKVKTKFILNNGFNPVWNEEFELIVRVPELAIVSFLVYDQNPLGKNEILGYFALPFSAIAEGW
ncbi:1-phosphatidylinositol 4:5-bisphosphate phosphodiesterase eta-2-like protein [Leptotrombidium deliense]|uniref:Phosphoinositide phospholipase C n=1 Tax=Leptotrombidium deliense TaxID=299467 RepID=A0A443SNS4_9ACAR|nr:1-phosphatidylinositol 4:5-bisphosphate phosphodiesterase eta-2-like protein [Leptotrombidium deliense]